MHKHLSRGKRLDNGEWIEGCLIIYDWNNRYVSIYSIEEEMTFQVDPKTVGRCTGIPDKNGRMIFEGDIVKFINELEEVNAPEIGVVVYEQSECCFEVQRKVKAPENVHIPESISVACLFDDERCTYEVVGNIHDNPELVGNNDMLEDVDS